MPRSPAKALTSTVASPAGTGIPTSHFRQGGRMAASLANRHKRDAPVIAIARGAGWSRLVAPTGSAARITTCSRRSTKKNPPIWRAFVTSG